MLPPELQDAYRPLLDEHHAIGIQIAVKFFVFNDGQRVRHHGDLQTVLGDIFRHAGEVLQRADCP
jgi:hypothetical protein